MSPFAPWKKEVVQVRKEGNLYLSVPFTWLLPEAERISYQWEGKIVAGGPAVKLMGAPWADATPESAPFDFLNIHNPQATFTTRGCINQCPFCAVPKIEGEFRELPKWKIAPIVCDNNITAASKKHFKKIIYTLREFPQVDFNQGLDARLFSSFHADEICKLKKIKVRFAFDHPNMEQEVKDAIDLCRRKGLKEFGVYVLIGLNDSPEEAKYKLEKVREWGALPNPMRFQPLNSLQKNRYVGEGWTERELRNMMRYYSRLNWLAGVSYEEYCEKVNGRVNLWTNQENF